jgi:hypothetical protein
MTHQEDYKKWIKKKLEENPNYWKERYKDRITKNPNFLKKMVKVRGIKNENYRKNNLEYYRKSQRKYAKNNPNKIISQQIADRKTKLGKSCEICGSTEKLQRHHKDYSKPLEIITLCSVCHKDVHSKYQNKIVEVT